MNFALFFLFVKSFGKDLPAKKIIFFTLLSGKKSIEKVSEKIGLIG